LDKISNLENYIFKIMLKLYKENSTSKIDKPLITNHIHNYFQLFSQHIKKRIIIKTENPSHLRKIFIELK